MLLSKIAGALSVGVLLSLVSLAAGCAAPAETTAEGAAALASDEGVFKLYDDAGPADPQCDIHTLLSLAHQRIDGELRAQLSEAVSGACRLQLAADERAYVVFLASTDCGSKIYKGQTKDGDRAITITDNRDRLCNDYVPAIVVEERGAKGDVRTLQASAK